MRVILKRLLLALTALVLLLVLTAYGLLRASLPVLDGERAMPGLRGEVGIERDGPPFSVPEEEVQALFGTDWTIDLLERRPIPADHPGYVGGVSRLDTATYALRKR